MRRPTAEELIEYLGLEPHPAEGGYFRETYRTGPRLPPEVSGGVWSAERDLTTAIYYLLTSDTRSVMHRLASDEIYHFYMGDPVTMLLLSTDGSSETLTLGTDVLAGEHVQVVVDRGVWQGLILRPGGAYALLGTTVAPGFEYDDYEEGGRAYLAARYPKHTELITKLT